MAVKSNDTNLSELLQTVANGKSQLPDFQRSWVWDDTRICKLPKIRRYFFECLI